MQNISGTEYLKWLLVLGDEKESVLITAAFRKEMESQLSETLNGYEIVATAKDKESGRPMTILQVMLFDEQRYFIIQGLVSSQNRQPFLNVFKEMAKTFRRK